LTAHSPAGRARSHAAPAERARRRYLELKGYGETISLETVAAQLKERDARDAGRTEAPLKAAPDSHLIDTTDMSVEQVMNMAVQIVDAALAI